MTVTLSPLASNLLLCLYQHRLMSTGQLQRLLLPAAADGSYLRRELSRLRASGLADAVSAGSAGTGLWFVTGAGAELAEHSRQVIARPYRMTTMHAAGPLRHHTLAVNDVGIAFVTAARSRGDTCGPLDWIPEVAHMVGRRRQLICDALLDYVVEDECAGTRTQVQWFIELDRATMPAWRLAAKLAMYAEYAQRRSQGRGGEPEWRHRYRRLPRLLVVLAGADETALERRLCDVAAAAAADGSLQRAHIAAGATTLTRLTGPGPFEPICRRLGGIDAAACDVLLKTA